MSAIRLVDGGYRYPGSERWIFRHLEFSVNAGEAVHVTGRNGSGKTTLLKALAGVLALTEGKLEGAGKRIAYMDQFAGDMLARDLTIHEHLKMAAPVAYSRATASDQLAPFDIGLSDRLNEFVGHLSGGQRQVVALLSTLAAGANVLCLDEFTSSMDDYSATVAGKLIDYARSQSTAIVLVSHAVPSTLVNREFSLPGEIG